MTMSFFFVYIKNEKLQKFNNLYRLFLPDNIHYSQNVMHMIKYKNSLHVLQSEEGHL